MASSKKPSRAGKIPALEWTDLGWLTTLPTEVGTFLDKPIDLLITDYDFEATKPDRAVVRFAEKILANLPMVLEQAETALREAVREEPETWPKNPDPILTFGLECTDTSEWIFGVEAVDNEGGSWDIEFTGTKLNGIFPAQD